MPSSAARRTKSSAGKIQLEVEGKRGAIARFKTQQQATRKNEEYQAFTKEIGHFEVDIQALEDKELEFMEQSEEIQKISAAAEKDFTKSQGIIQEQIARLEAGAHAATARLAELEADHAKLRPTCRRKCLISTGGYL